MSPGKVYSFDIFDTLLTRRTATALGVFCVMQHQLRAHGRSELPLQLVEEFFEIRASADQRARELSDADEVDLEQIYTQIANRFPDVPAELIQEIKQLELDTEADLVVGIPRNIRRAHRLLDDGQRVILVCDSYLGEEDLRRLLRSVDKRLAECSFYVSSRFKETKLSGALFRRVLQAEGLRPMQLVHYGHNPRSDYKSPRALRIRATLDMTPLLSGIEHHYLEENSLFSQLLAGVGKTYRILHPDASPQAVVGACLAGPMFYGYILDVLARARALGLRRLYFIARDGMVFLMIAEAIARERGIDIELRYLYGSRRAFRLPSVFEITPREHGWLAERIPALSLAMLAERVEMAPEELYALLPAPFRDSIPDLDASLPEGLTNSILRQLDRVPAIRDRILGNARKARAEVVAYLAQAGFFEVDRVGTVDIGWMGGSQDSLYKIAASHKRDIEIHGFYFGLFHYSPYTSTKNAKTAYAIIPNHTEDNIIALHTELLAQADHGHTIGFRREEDGLVRPILRGDGAHLRDWGVADFHAGVDWFAREYARLASTYPLVAQTFLSVIPRLFCAIKKPSSLIAETLGSIPYSGDHCDLRLREIAPAFDLRQAFAYSFSERYENRRLMTEWYAATLARSAFPVRLVLRLDPLAQGAKFAIKHSLLVAIAKVRAARATLEYLVSEYAARTLKLLKARRSPSSDAMDP
jgi:FMN phosphatase YigB (HAD superfamily)